MEAAVAGEEEALHQQQQQQQAEHASINNLPPAILHGVFSHLGPKNLCCVSCTCLLWRRLTRDRVSNSTWRHFYTQRWSVMPPAGDGVCWQSKYGSKMKQVCAYPIDTCVFDVLTWTCALLYAQSAGSSRLLLCLWQILMTQLYVQHDSVPHPNLITHTRLFSQQQMQLAGPHPTAASRMLTSS
jgi:hypothetical protein